MMSGHSTTSIFFNKKIKIERPNTGSVTRDHVKYAS